MIKILKLISGEEIIGDVTEENNGYTIKQPCVLQMVMSRSDPTVPSMSLIPYAFYVEDHTIVVETQNALWIAKPVDEVYNQYNRIFGTGIQLPT